MFHLMVQQSEKPARGKEGERMHGWADLFLVVGLSLCKGTTVPIRIDELGDN